PARDRGHRDRRIAARDADRIASLPSRRQPTRPPPPSPPPPARRGTTPKPPAARCADEPADGSTGPGRGGGRQRVKTVRGDSTRPAIPQPSLRSATGARGQPGVGYG